ncbi:hypothetical protein P3T43_003356 [Paraburkholderia sp. GAS41]
MNGTTTIGYILGQAILLYVAHRAVKWAVRKAKRGLGSH